MKKTFTKIISIILVLCMVFPIMASAAAGNEVTRVSVTINGDSATKSRNRFAGSTCWYRFSKG